MNSRYKSDKMKKYEKQAKDLGQEKRQEILDMFKSGTKTVGQICNHFNLSLYVIMVIIYQNIKSTHIMNEKAI